MLEVHSEGSAVPSLPTVCQMDLKLSGYVPNFVLAFHYIYIYIFHCIYLAI